jgi:C1A family cysteine protease
MKQLIQYMKTASILMMLFLVSCSKDIIQPVQEQRVGGLLPDKPNHVKILVSNSFAQISTDIKTSEIAGRGKVDKSAPSVSFTYPLTGTNVSGTVQIVVYTKDNVGVVAQGIIIAGKEVSSTSTYSWNTTGLPSGYYTLIAWAKDAAGNSRQTSITVSINTVVVEPPPPPPSTSLVQVKPMPPVMNQGGEGACAAFAIGYAARSVEYYNKTKDSSKTFSPEHLYNQVKFGEDCYSGTAMQTALEFIIANGILPLSSMPYSSTNGCSLQPTELQKQEALAYKIDGFVKMYTTDIATIKGMIQKNKPVIIGIVTDYAFDNAGLGFIWKTPNSTYSIPHCIVICGYDDTKNAYLIMNSWGTGWGDKGYCWMDYDLFTTRTGTYCYSIQ